MFNNNCLAKVKRVKISRIDVQRHVLVLNSVYKMTGE
jgi:hypothetical protein